MKNSAGSADIGFITSRNRPLCRNAAGKRSGPVDDVISWAWRDELPKLPKRQDGPMAMGGGWDSTGRYSEYLSLVELHGVNQYGAVPDFSADSWPCRDAQLIGAAVMALDDCVMELPEDWRPAPELDRFGGIGAKAVSEAWRRMTHDDGQGQVTLRLRPSELIIRRAVMGADLDGMALDGTEQRFEASGNGKEKWFVQKTVDTIVGANSDGSDRTMPQLVELNGFNSKQQRPMPGAYRKPFLDPDPVPAIIARAEHEIWLSALAIIFDTVSRQLEDVEMLPCTMPVAPWLEPASSARVLPDLVAAEALRAADEERRRTAFAGRFPRWFRKLEKQREKMDASPA